MPHSKQTDLSEREKQLIKLASEGYIDTAIAKELGISEATVSTYWGRIRVKLGPFSRTELVTMVLREESEQMMASLKEENEKLAKQIRLQSGEYGDQRSANFYQDLIEIAADAIFVVNQDGVIENLNQSAAEMFGFEQAELRNQPVTSLMPERFRRIHNSHRANYFFEPTRRKMGDHSSTVALHKSGKEFLIAATLSSIKVESGFNVLCIVREVTL